LKPPARGEPVDVRDETSRAIPCRYLMRTFIGAVVGVRADSSTTTGILGIIGRAEVTVFDA